MSDAQKHTNFNVVIVSPDATIFEGQAIRLLAPSPTQQIAILPDHTPLYSELGKGQIQLFLPEGDTKTFDIEAGILRVKANTISIITGF